MTQVVPTASHETDFCDLFRDWSLFVILRSSSSQGKGKAMAVKGHLDVRRERLAYFTDVMCTAQESRPEGMEIVDNEFGEPEPEWKVFERQCMKVALDRELSELDLPESTCQEVKAIENRANGHANYAFKWALACADLIEDRQRVAGAR